MSGTLKNQIPSRTIASYAKLCRVHSGCYGFPSNIQEFFVSDTLIYTAYWGEISIFGIHLLTFPFKTIGFPIVNQRKIAYFAILQNLHFAPKNRTPLHSIEISSQNYSDAIFTRFQQLWLFMRSRWWWFRCFDDEIARTVSTITKRKFPIQNHANQGNSRKIRLNPEILR